MLQLEVAATVMETATNNNRRLQLVQRNNNHRLQLVQRNNNRRLQLVQRKMPHRVTARKVGKSEAYRRALDPPKTTRMGSSMLLNSQLIK